MNNSPSRASAPTHAHPGSHTDAPTDGKPPTQHDPFSHVPKERRHYRFHHEHDHLSPVFGSDNFGATAESFARFFGTPTYLVGQSVLVMVWIVINWLKLVSFDPYPFILLNLAFSLQAAYAAPLILLAQTRQAARDKAHADADARHREDLAEATRDRQEASAKHTAEIQKLVEANLALTQMTRELSERIEQLTHQIHSRVVPSDLAPESGT